MAGHYDLEVSLAARHNWTYTQTTQQPRLFVQELLARHEAEGKHQKKLDKDAALANGSGGGEPADFPEVDNGN